METATLVVSDPPHREVDLHAAAELLELDVFVMRLKTKFRAPEVLFASGPNEAGEFAADLRGVGLNVSTLSGKIVNALPWPDPVTSLAFDNAALRLALRDETVEIAYGEEIVGVYCRPPDDFTLKEPVDLGQAVVSGHGPTIAMAIQGMSNIDLYFHHDGWLRRISIVPDFLEVDGEEVAIRLGDRFERLRLDTRLAGVRPRGRSVSGKGFDPNQRKGYSYGTRRLREALERVSRELSEVPHYELGSRLAYALHPLGPPG